MNTSSTLTMSCAAVVVQNNDVYLRNGKVITAGNLDANTGIVAKITPQNTAPGTVVLKADTAFTLTSVITDRFTLKDGLEMSISIDAQGQGVLRDPAAAARFVAVAYNSNKAAYSGDGVTWTEASLPVSANWQSVTARTD